MTRPHLRAWTATTLQRIYPKNVAGPSRVLTLDAARGERISFQVGLKNDALEAATVKLALQVPAGWLGRVRRAGFVAVPHLNVGTQRNELENAKAIPGLVPDPLFNEDTLRAGPLEADAFWCNLTIPPDARPGRYAVRAILSTEKHETVANLSVQVQVHALVLQPRQNFPVIQWFYCDSLCDYYKVEPFDEAFWRSVQPYMQDVVAHWQDTIYTPVFTPPLDGVKRPHQLLKIRRKGDDYLFDWSDVERWVELARRSGIRNFEWTHFFTQWGVKHAIRIYERAERHGELLWPPETGATGPVYRRFLSQFLPEFKRFLDKHNLTEHSFFHVSDEPHGEHIRNYRAARELLRELAPWMKTLDALSDIEFGRQQVVDLPVPSIKTTLQFMREKIECGTYYCCNPKGKFVNRFMDTPLAKIRMNGWLFYRFQPKLFLHWGYNYWYKSQTQQLIDPFSVSDGQAWPGWAYGDTFCVYPGPNGPIDSIRWEVFAESMQDFALLQSAGIDPQAACLRRLKSFEDFPKSAAWVMNTRRQLLKAASR